jgi:hypothetical protein
MKVKLIHPLIGQCVIVNNVMFRRIWSEYNDIILWDRYDEKNDEWKKVKTDHQNKLELIYNKSIEDNLEVEINKIIEFLEN